MPGTLSTRQPKQRSAARRTISLNRQPEPANNAVPVRFADATNWARLPTSPANGLLT